MKTIFHIVLLLWLFSGYVFGILFLLLVEDNIPNWLGITAIIAFWGLMMLSMVLADKSE